MKRKTSTRQIQNTIKSNQLILQSAEVYNKTTQETETIPNDKFMECFDFFCKSGIFMDAVGWHFERNNKTDDYLFESGRMNGDVDIIVSVYCYKNDGVCTEEIEKLLYIEEE